MTQYEALIIFPPEETPDAAKEEEKRFEEALRRLGGRSLEKREWGRRPLGYSLRKFREGRLVLWNVEIEGSQVGELKKSLALDEKILKATLTRFIVPKPVKERKRKPRAQRPPRPAEPREREAVHGRQPQ